MLEFGKLAGTEIAGRNGSEDLASRIRGRRNALLGLWAASRMHMSDTEANAYARDLAIAGIQGLDDEAIVGRILRDCAERGFGVPEATARKEMRRLMELAALEHGAAPGQYRIAAA